MKHASSLCRTALSLLVAALLTAACSQPKDRFRFSGSIDGVSQAELYIYSDDGTMDGVDTIRIDGGKFDYERQLAQPAVLVILYPNFSQTYIVAEPGAHVKMAGNAARLSEADISGTQDNEMLTDFRRQVSGKRDADVRLAATQFIRANKATLAAYAVFKQYFASAQYPDPATTRSLLTDLRGAQPRNAALTALDSRLRRQLATAPGEALPPFSLKGIDGHTYTNAAFSGRPLIVAIAATWASESAALYEALSRIRRAYGGRIGLLLVSLDADSEACRQRLRRDSLYCPAVCDGRAFDSQAAQAFGADRVPGNLLVGADGRIIARDLAPEELERRAADALR